MNFLLEKISVKLKQHHSIIVCKNSIFIWLISLDNFLFFIQRYSDKTIQSFKTAKMSNFLLFDYDMDHKDSLRALSVRFIDTKLVKQQPKHFTSISSKFQQNMKQIIKILIDQQLSFNNTSLIASDADFFIKVLPAEFKKRGLQYPFIMENFIDIEKVFRTHCNAQMSTTLQSMAKFFGQYRNCEQLSLLTTVVMNLNQKGLLNMKTSKNDKQSSKNVFFSAVGLPYSITKDQFLKRFQLNHLEKTEVTFLKQKDGRFSGKAIIKTDSKRKQHIQSIHLKTIKSRYIQVYQIEQEEFNKQKKDKVQSFKEHKFYRKNQSYSRSRSHSRSHEKHRSRSRERQHSRDSARQNQKICDSYYYACLRIKGLPYSFSVEDLEHYFKNFYSIAGSGKMGHKQGRRSGEAMILLGDVNWRKKAQQQLNGQYIGGRYIELQLASLEQYNRFR